MTVNLSELLSLYKQSDVDSFLKELTGHDLTESSLTYDDIKNNWRYLGDNSSNGSVIGMLKKGEKGLIERVTNAIDAVVENKKDECGIATAKNSGVVIAKAFPKYYENCQAIRQGADVKSNCKDATNQVILAVTDAKKSNKPTFDVVDQGTGLRGEQFPSTILSINAGNKISSDRNYLIGAFGQGGSTSIPFTASTIIVSKQDGKFWFTVIKAVDLTELKTTAYVYLVVDGAIPEAENDWNSDFEKKEWLKVFANSKSGTLVRMVEMDISADYRKNDIAKPGMLGDYVNTQLFDVALPVRIIDDRQNFTALSSSQTRYAYGTAMKLLTYKYVQKDYSGRITIVHNNRQYQIDYYVLLPENEENWASDGECKSIFRQFNVTGDPILYTVNGQMVTSETYTCIKNAGLNFLRYRLLVVINLDVLGAEKYKFFTTDCSQIKQTDLTKGFLDNVVEQLAKEEKLKEINDYIANLSVNSAVSQEMLDDISRRVKKNYSGFLRNGRPIIIHHGPRPGPNPVDASDEIEYLKISTTKNEYYRDQVIPITLETGAQKYVNQEAIDTNTLNCFVDDHSYSSFVPTCFNGRVTFKLEARDLVPGKHSIDFEYYQRGQIKFDSGKFQFVIKDEDTPEPPEARPSQDLNLEILPVNDGDLICDVAKIDVQHKIIVKINTYHEMLYNEVYGHNPTADELSSMQRRMIEPIATFSLFLDKSYDEIESDEEKNKLVLSFVKTYFACKLPEED